MPAAAGTAALANNPPSTSLTNPPRLLLAYSGGLDSAVLLDLLVQARQSLPFELHALHVHHGLSPHADRWVEACAAQCLSLQVPFMLEHIKLNRKSGLGVEATARDARYQVLRQQAAEYIVLAHHQDDQAETLLLQMLRGAGVKGLAAMARVDAKKHLLRPLLDISRADILAYAQARQLRWVEDESNSDTHFDRNFCRHDIIPTLEKRYPAAKAVLARVAGHMAEASQLLDQLAVMDAQLCIQQQDGQSQLNLQPLSQLDAARAKNLLRWWLCTQGYHPPSAGRLQEMLKQLLSAKADGLVNIALDAAGPDAADNASLRRYKQAAYIQPVVEHLPLALLWQGEAELLLPDGSRLLFEKQMGSGLAIVRLHIGKLRIAQRTGGERFKPEAARPTRTLKHLLQEAAMPPWLRQRLPLVYCDDTLAVVPGIGIASHMQAAADEEGLFIRWQQTTAP